LPANQALKICVATSEYTPLAKTGGLADVSASLSAHLHRAGHDVRVLLPFYSTLKLDGFDVEPVEGLQNLSLQVGPHQGSVSIDSAQRQGGGPPVYLLRCPELYDRSGIYSRGPDEHLRFVVLSRAAIEMCQHMGFAPDIFSCHDWHTALVPLYLKSVYAWDQLFANTRSVLTIHNIGYQGVFGAGQLPDLGLGDAAHLLHQDDLQRGVINFMKTGVLYADCLTTVSPTYAREIQGEEYGMGLHPFLQQRGDSVVGILNGVDADWDPATDSLIPAQFDSQDLSGKRTCKQALIKEMGLAGPVEIPLIGVVTRLVGQKGIELMQQTLPQLLKQRDFSIAALGSGEPRYEQFFSELQATFPGRVSFYRGYNNTLAHWIEAGSDMFLMPSLYEPCGLNQMYSLKYGTVPIVRETGGLADSVEQIDPAGATGTGVLFRHYDAPGLWWAINRALDLYADRALWHKVMLNGMAQDFSWDRQVERYVELFRQLGAQG
jgi:starch synthase